MDKFLFRPVRPFSISQRFGENTACISTNGSRTVISCDGFNPPMGYKSAYGDKGHQGLDIYAYTGQPVYCAFDGSIASIDTQERSGLDVRVVSDFQGKRYLHIYEHLSGINNLKIGDKVTTGECLGWAGTTGLSSGPHLHFEVRVMQDGKWIPIDPLNIMNGFFAPDVDKVKAIMEKIIVILEDVIEKLRKW